jgi:hypothetical protein
MPCELQFDGPVVLVEFHGAVTATEIHDVVDRVASDSRFDDQRYHVVDWRRATLPPLDDAILLATAPVIGATVTNPGITTIFVPDGEPTRRFAEHCAPTFRHLRLRFAASVGEAMDWIYTQTQTLAPVPETAN